MSFANSYRHPADEDLSACYGPEPYDLNFVFPIHDHLALLESDRVKLTPFIPRIHADALSTELAKHPETMHWIPSSLVGGELLDTMERVFRRAPGNVAFAIIDKGRGGALAGLITLIDAAPAALSAEIAWVIILPPFQRTYVATHATGLLLRYCLDLPRAAPPGLGLRRVQWVTHNRNARSEAAALRLGFAPEGTRRWARVLGRGQEGNGVPPRAGDPRETHMGRGDMTLSLCWDDWEGGARAHVEGLMARQ